MPKTTSLQPFKFLIRNSINPGRILLVIFFAASGCQTKKIDLRTEGADKLQVHYVVDGAIGITRMAEDAAAIKNIAFIFSKSDLKDSVGCAYTAGGVMEFYKGDSLLQQVSFTDPSSKCLYITYHDQQNKPQVAEMTNEAAAFLRSLRSGEGY